MLDRLFAGLLMAQWLLAICLAIYFAPYTYNGLTRSIHPHMYLAVIGGGLLSLYPLFVAIKMPGTTTSKYVISTAQMLFGSL
ncbi:MAG: two-component sensor histidine kinase, partial [Proteobacteria bacterium]